MLYPPARTRWKGRYEIMLTHNLGYPRIGAQRQLKKACESYWAGKSSLEQLQEAGKLLRKENWLLQRDAGIELVPCNDFSFYDHVLDMTLAVGAIPERYRPLIDGERNMATDLYFAMARGHQARELDLIAMEMTKWFDTNYHYLVPEFYKDQIFKLSSRKIIDEFREAQGLGVTTKPVLLGPITYLLLGKEKHSGFHRLELLPALLLVYSELLAELQGAGAEYVQIDEPFLTMDLDDAAKAAYRSAYDVIYSAAGNLKIIVATYFDALRDNVDLAAHLPVHALHIDLIRAPEQLTAVLANIPANLTLTLGLVDGRNIWKNDLAQSLSLLSKAAEKLGAGRLMVAPSCSLLHAPCDLSFENNEIALPKEVNGGSPSRGRSSMKSLRWRAFPYRQPMDALPRDSAKILKTTRTVSIPS
jgi:5-methyltetrahydropteroyltriglutamate--homocysteine methyltransferase